MNLRDLLSEEDKNKIDYYISRFAETPDIEPSENRASVDYILRIWDANKQKLFHMFGDKFILERSFSFKQSDELLEEPITHLLYDIDSPIYKFRKTTEKVFDEIGDYGTKFDIKRLFLPKHLASNLYQGCGFTLIPPNGHHKIEVPYGCKVSKILGKIAKEFGIPGYEEFRIELSQILNHRNLCNGTICLSIHPLDYMTMSDNENNWTSCMSWMDDGCYRQGTVEMMNSPIVVVAYLKSENEQLRIGFANKTVWNSKKWRELFVVRPDLITEVKPYPWANKDLTTFCLDWLKELADAANYGEYEKKVVTYPAFSSQAKVCISPETNMMYNDFGTINHRGYWGKFLRENKELSFNYSGPSECMWCGRTDNEVNFTAEERLICEDCSPGYQCPHCGKYWDSEEDWYDVDGDWVCPDCAELAYQDLFTEDLHFKENMIDFGLSFDNGQTFYKTDSYMISYDFGNQSHSDYFSEGMLCTATIKDSIFGRPGEATFVVCVENLTEIGKEQIIDTLGGCSEDYMHGHLFTVGKAKKIYKYNKPKISF